MLKFKKLLAIFILAVLLPTTVFAASTYELVQVYYPIYSNNQYLDTGDKPILNYEGTTYLPIRKVAEALSIPIEWDGINQRVNINTVDVNKLAESCVMIYVNNGQRDVEQGSGVIIGYNQVLTCNHVTNKGTSYRIQYNGSVTTQATFLMNNASYDMSILVPDNKTVKPVKIGDSDDVRTGDKIVLISSPKQQKNVVAYGEILGTTEFMGIKGIATDASVMSGSSGGAVFLQKTGELIGIIDATVIDKYEVTMFVPINDIRKVMAN